MLWHYDKDLSGYTLGQGGYYSPQEYVSFALPVTWRKRTENWSWELGGSVSWSHSKTDDVRYPLQNLIPTDEPGRYTDRGVMETGSSSSGTVIPQGPLLSAGLRPTGLLAGRGYSGSERLYPEPCADLCALFCGGLAGRYGLTAATAHSVRGLVIRFTLIHL
jgi:hypothetical protein